MGRLSDPRAVLLVNSQSGRAAVQVPARSLMTDDGEVERRVRLIRPMEHPTVALTTMPQTHWQQTDRATFSRVWAAEVAEVPEFTDSEIHIVSGLLLPIWKRLPNESTRVYRLQTDTGERIIGRKVSPAWVVGALSTGMTTLTPEQAFMALLDGKTVLDLTDGLQLRRVRVMGANRIELKMPAHCLLRLPELNCGDKGLVGQMTIANLGEDMSAAIIRVTSLNGETRSYTISAANPVVTVLGTDAPTLDTWLELGKTYINLGIDHILLGADHLLFVLGLIWIVQGGWRLLKTITAFTIGHSASLAAAAFGWIGVPEGPLNACIALSIVFVGVEIVKQQRGEIGLTARYPWAVAFSFGLVHG
ncbi:MAG: HupE/UreJ family protein, partial [Bradyrhizobium sp.]|nr:HupE/UreJ family protein [Bradyrhizobium sp.]